MTLSEWTQQIISELKAAGFDAKKHFGLPLVERPTRFEDGVRLIDLKLSMSVEKRIYAEGMIFVPPGAFEEGKRLRENSSNPPAAPLSTSMCQPPKPSAPLSPPNPPSLPNP